MKVKKIKTKKIKDISAEAKPVEDEIVYWQFPMGVASIYQDRLTYRSADINVVNERFTLSKAGLPYWEDWEALYRIPEKEYYIQLMRYQVRHELALLKSELDDRFLEIFRGIQALGILSLACLALLLVIVCLN